LICGEGSYLDYQEPTMQKPTFTVSSKNYGLNSTIFIENIVYDDKIKNGTIYYSKVNEDGSENYQWLETGGTQIQITESGDYAIKIVDSKGIESDITTINITLVNSPKLEEGMTPVVWDETAQKWKQVDKNSGEWYNYSSDTRKWANIMLQDGLAIDSNGYVTSMGSMFVWVPRYMYQIETLYHTASKGRGGIINIKFLKGNSTIPTDNVNIIVTNASGQGNWNIHPAFQYGDKEITGIWVAKFEATAAEGVANSTADNVTTKNIKVVPNVQNWRNISIGNMYIVSTKMKTNTSLYGVGIESCDPHLMKNSEWGAVAYITQSKYGRSGTQVAINNSTSHYTGRSSGAPGASNTTTSSEGTYTYETEEGQLASTTGNVYGIYDLSGGSLEYVAGYVNNSSTTSYGQALLDAPKEHKDVYEVGSAGDGQENNYNENSSIYGDAVYETSGSYSGTTSWFWDDTVFPYSSDPFFRRGGNYDSGPYAGVFAFSHKNGVNSYYSFRPVLVLI